MTRGDQVKRIELFFLFIEPADLDQIKVILINEYPTVTTNGQESIFFREKKMEGPASNLH